MKNLFRRRRSLSCEANNEKGDFGIEDTNRYLDNNGYTNQPAQQEQRQRQQQQQQQQHASLRRRMPRSRTSDLATLKNNNNNCGNSKKTDWSYCRPPRPNSEDFSTSYKQHEQQQNSYRDNNLNLSGSRELPPIVQRKKIRKHHSFTNRIDNVNSTFDFASEEDEEDDNEAERSPRRVLRPLSNSNSFTSFENKSNFYLSSAKVNNGGVKNSVEFYCQQQMRLWKQLFWHKNTPARHPPVDRSKKCKNGSFH